MVLVLSSCAPVINATVQEQNTREETIDTQEENNTFMELRIPTFNSFLWEFEVESIDDRALISTLLQMTAIQFWDENAKTSYDNYLEEVRDMPGFRRDSDFVMHAIHFNNIYGEAFDLVQFVLPFRDDEFARTIFNDSSLTSEERALQLHELGEYFLRNRPFHLRITDANIRLINAIKRDESITVSERLTLLVEMVENLNEQMWNRLEQFK